jgi:hypothetical protein
MLIINISVISRKKLGLRTFSDFPKSSCNRVLFIVEGSMRATVQTAVLKQHDSFSKASRDCTQISMML